MSLHPNRLSTVARAAQTTFAIAGLLALAGCKKLPDIVPCKAEILGHERLPSVIGRTLAFQGKDIGKIGPGQISGTTLITAEVRFTVPKAELPPMLGPGFTIHAVGACGAEDTPLEPPGQPWRDASENDRAKELEKSGAFPVMMTFKGFTTQRKLIVDWGGAKSIKVGSLALEKGDKPVVAIVFGDCKAPPAVTVDGTDVGVLDPKADTQLISGDPTACYQLHDVVYGNATSKHAPVNFEGKRTYALQGMPDYALESAPSTAKSSGSGFTTSELIRVRCSR
jgi:hypothetical protein